MLEQQFLTTFNNISNFTLSSQQRDKKKNLIIDFINGTYQGYLTSRIQPDGLGTIIDDQFNYIFCSNWNKGKIDGNTFIKLASQIIIWGLWSNNIPKKYSCVKIGLYLILIPYWDYNKVKRPKKCLVYHQGKGKIYLTTIQHYPQGNKSKRQYSIVVQKIILIKQKSISQAAILINMAIQQYQLDAQSYLNYLNNQLQVLRMQYLHNSIFITANISEIINKTQVKLGLLLDNKKMIIKSVGIYMIKNNAYENNQNNKQNTGYAYLPRLNGLGLAKTMQSQTIIGIFKQDMLIRQLNSQQNIQKIRNNTKNYSRNINGSVVKQILQHQHMKSINYQHNYLYFPEIKTIVTKAIEIQKYIQMFQRLSYYGNNYMEENTSIDNNHHTEKYQNNQYIVKQQQSSGSIIDQFSQLRVNLNLNKDIYKEGKGVEQGDQQFKGDVINNLHPRTTGNQIQDSDVSHSTQSKKPGFILSRNSRILTQNSQKSKDKKAFNKSPRKSPLAQKNPRLFHNFSPKNSPLKTQFKWRR